MVSLVLRCNNVCLSLDVMNDHINELTRLAEAGDARGIRQALKRIVPEYTPWDGGGSGKQ